jgi:ectoine hydroxylase-related dioxygenase (phytanoyl-CoA dioxygenase family)
MTDLQQDIEQQGFAVLPGILDAERVARLVSELEAARLQMNGSVLQSRGQVYGIRNLVDVWPAVLPVVHVPGLLAAIGSVLPQGFGLVRSIFFDKPPRRTWSLPWHRDLTIAVRDARSTPGEFRRPTVKAGVAHLEAPPWLLRGMLTARVALDDVVDENGPLLVIPGSHRDVSAEALPSEQELLTRARAIHMNAGDVLLIRPLVVHRSGASRAGTSRHRRTLHFEFAPEQSLPGGLAWHRFLGVTL